MNNPPRPPGAAAFPHPAPVAFVPGESELPRPIGPDTAGDAPLLLLVDAATDPRWAGEAAIAIAAAWARAGRRVVLADLHLEDPVLHDRLGESNLDGVVDIFLYGASVARSARPPRDHEFFLIPSGTYTAAPEDVYGHPRWKKLIAGFQEAGATLMVFLPLAAPGYSLVTRWGRDAVLLGVPATEPGAGLDSLDVRAVLVPPAEQTEAPAGEVGPALGSPGASAGPDFGPDPEPVEMEPGHEPAHSTPEPELERHPERDDADAPGEPSPLERAGADPVDVEADAASRVRAAPAEGVDPRFSTVDGDEAEPDASVQAAPLAPLEIRVQPRSPEPGPTTEPEWWEPEPGAGEPRSGEPVEVEPAAADLDEAPPAPGGVEEDPSSVAAAAGPRPAEPEAAPTSGMPVMTSGRRRRRSGPGPMIWLLVGVGLLAAAVLVTALARPDLFGGLGRAGAAVDTLGNAEAIPPAPPAPVPAGDTLAFAVQVRAYASLEPARTQAERQARRVDGTPFYVVPELTQGVRYYKVLAGLLPDTTAAMALRQRLVEAGVIAAEDARDDAPGTWSLIQSRPLAFHLGEYPDAERARARTDSLTAAAIPAYPVALPYSDGTSRFRVYAGAYPDSAQADELAQMLRAAELPARLVARLGQASPAVP